MSIPETEILKKEKAEALDLQRRMMLAGDPATSPQILQGLADDASVEVRMAVAENQAAPVKAQVLLALDQEEGVRAALARRAASLAAKLAQDGVAHAAALALHTLEALALDQAVNVRVALSTSLKDVALAPPKLIKRLAQDIAREVAEPILRYCLALSDDDLIELIGKRDDDWSKSAIAARPSLSPQVSGAIVESGDKMAIVTLLNNDGAAISEEHLTQLTEQSATEKAWQEGLARRPQLPMHLAKQLAEFVEEKVLLELRKRQDFDSETVQDIVATVRRRMDWIMASGEAKNGRERARRQFLLGELGESQISDALSWGEKDFVNYALALLARVPESIVEDILYSQSPRAVTALSWRAGLSMRCAMLLQMRAAEIPSNRLLNARGGSNYPLTEVEMIWQLEMFGVKC